MKTSLALLSALLCACTVGEVPGGGGGDAGPMGLAACVARVAQPVAAHEHTTAPLGPRARSACMDAGCHAAGGAGGQFAFAGTVYQETSAVTALAGVTLRFYKSGDKSSLVEATTDSAGNFVVRNAGMYTNFPYQTDVTSCDLSTSVKGIRPMIGPIATAEANCNTAGSCHGATGTQGAIYLTP